MKKRYVVHYKMILSGRIVIIKSILFVDIFYLVHKTIQWWTYELDEQENPMVHICLHSLQLLSRDWLAGVGLCYK